MLIGASFSDELQHFRLPGCKISRPLFNRLAPTQIGIYEVTFQLDSNAATGNNVVLSVAVNPTDGSATQFSNGSKIPIQ